MLDLTAQGSCTVEETQKSNYGNTVFNPSLSNLTNYPDASVLKYTSTDNAVTAIIPMPIKSILYLKFNATGTINIYQQLADF